MAFTAPKASTTARGYGHLHQAMRKRLAPIVAQGQTPCWRCGRPILPGQAWDLGHDDDDRSVYRGPEHRWRTRWCIGNRSAGARKGAQVVNGARRVVRPRTAAWW